MNHDYDHLLQFVNIDTSTPFYVILDFCGFHDYFALVLLLLFI